MEGLSAQAARVARKEKVRFFRKPVGWYPNTSDTSAAQDAGEGKFRCPRFNGIDDHRFVLSCCLILRYRSRGS